jgi:hypothetical protein
LQHAVDKANRNAPSSPRMRSLSFSMSQYMYSSLYFKRRQHSH